MENNKAWTPGGYNSIPLTCPKENFSKNFTEDITLDKRVLFDWISFTFDNLNIEKIFFNTMNNNLSIEMYNRNIKILNKLLVALGAKAYDSTFEFKQPGLNGYKYMTYIGEFIIINFHGPKSYRDKQTTQLLMRGEACREFIEYQNGSWVNLFRSLTDLNGSFKRVDIAIDDFKGDEVDIYELKALAEKGHWTGSFQSLKIINDISFRGGIYSKGFSMTFGSPGSNQLQIYDKNLERFSRNKETFDTKVWYRYEMRLVNEKATDAIREYLRAMAYDTSNINSFMEYASSLISEMIMFKQKPKGNDKRVRRWNPHKKWIRFLGTIKGISLLPQSKLEKTIDSKMRWYKKSIAGINAEFFLADEKNFKSFQKEVMSIGFKKIDKRKLEVINKKRVDNNLKPYTIDNIKNL